MSVSFRSSDVQLRFYYAKSFGLVELLRALRRDRLNSDYVASIYNKFERFIARNNRQSMKEKES